MVPLDNLSRLIIGAVLEDAVDQLAIVSATFGPVPETHFNEMKKSLESILIKMSEQEDGIGEGVTEIKQLQCETAYIQKVLEASISEIYKHGAVPSMETAVEAYRRRLSEKDDIINREEEIKTEIEQLSEAVFHELFELFNYSNSKLQIVLFSVRIWSFFKNGIYLVFSI